MCGTPVISTLTFALVLAFVLLLLLVLFVFLVLFALAVFSCQLGSGLELNLGLHNVRENFIQ